MTSERTKENAYLALPHLVYYAQARKTITYSALTAKIGRHVRAARHFLYYIRDEICIPRDLPLLTAIVVRKNTELPGESWLPEGTGHLTPDEYRQEFERYRDEVFACDAWDALLEELGLAPVRKTDDDLHDEGMAYTAVRERRGQIDEAEERREMKRFVAQDPSVIDLHSAEPGELDYVFVSGDRCDVAFDLGENGHAVVVVKLGGRGELVVAIYEAIKCRALMQAEKGRGRDYSVSAHVVAHDIPEDIAAFANRFDVRCRSIASPAVTSREDL